MIQLKLYTEMKSNLSKITAKYFDNFTIYNAIGYYKGIKEKSAIIEIIIPDINSNNYLIKIHSLISDIKIANNQELVLLTRVKNYEAMLI